MDGIYKNIEKYNPNKKRKTIVFDEMIDACLVIKNLIVTELFIRDRKLNLSFVFIPQSYFTRKYYINSMHYFMMKIPNKRELQQIAFNHSSNIDFKDSMNLYRKCTAKPNSFFSYWCYSCIRQSFTFQKDSFRKNIKTNHDNWWWEA